MSKHILGISGCFPRPKRPDYGTFADALYREMVRQGAEVSVIAPYPILRAAKEMLVIGKNEYAKTDKYSEMRIERPLWWSWSSRYMPFKNHRRVNFENYCRAVKGICDKNPKPDLVSAYFFDAGCAALNAYEGKIPVYVEIGESDFRFYEQIMTNTEIESYLKRFAGVIAVSKTNYALIKEYDKSGKNIFCLENGVDTSKFIQRDKKQMREQLGLPLDKSIIGYVGAFIERKGPLRLINAVNNIPNTYAIFMGRGPQRPRGERVLLSEPVNNELIPFYLAACDVFCLPSLHEGLSIAILEAAACGIPLVVSDRPFNRSFLTDKQALFVDPLSLDSIGEGIRCLIEDSVRKNNMGIECRIMAEKHSLAYRVKCLFEIISKQGKNE